MYRDVSGELIPLEDMSEVPLIQPPQGGKVMFVGVRARNVDVCHVTLRTALIDPENGGVVSLERRPVSLESAPDGWLEPVHLDGSDGMTAHNLAANLSNLPACPRAGLSKAITGEVYELHVTMETEDTSVDSVVHVVPRCAEARYLELCTCECALDYKLGASCGGLDAGEPDAS